MGGRWVGVIAQYLQLYTSRGNYQRNSVGWNCYYETEPTIFEEHDGAIMVCSGSGKGNYLAFKTAMDINDGPFIMTTAWSPYANKFTFEDNGRFKYDGILVDEYWGRLTASNYFCSKRDLFFNKCYQ